MRSPLLISLAALVLAACGVALPRGPAAPGQSTAETLVCALEIDEAGGSTRIAARVEAGAQPVTGAYDLRVQGGGADLRQGGPFELAGHEAQVLGELNLSGPARGLAMDLTVTADGRRQTCATEHP